jgi:hypothetical protein
MKALNRQSWWFKVAVMGCPKLKYNDSTDSCELFWAFVFGSAAVAATCALLLLLSGFFVGLPVTTIAMFFMSGKPLIDYILSDLKGFADGGRAVLCIEIFLFLCYLITEAIRHTYKFFKRRARAKRNALGNENKWVEEPHPLRIAFQGVKEKFCVKFDIEDTTNYH